MAEFNIDKMARNVAQKAMQELRDNEVFENIIVLPDNPTNGNIITTIFDIVEFHAIQSTIFVVLKDGTELEFKRDWFDAPYKRKVKE